MPARFITLEGIDGAGKSSHLEFIADWLRARGHSVVVTREPGGTTLGERLRELVLAEAMDAHTETLLIFAARSLHLQQVVRPALADGATVLCDRYTDATFAYQCGGRGVAEAFVAALAAEIHADLWPGLTLLFDTDAAVAQARVQTRQGADRFEREDCGFFTRVRARYLLQAQREPARFGVIDGGGSLEQVRERLARMLQARLA